MTEQPIDPPPNMEERVRQYVTLRDKKRELKKKHEEELKPYTEAMDMLEAYILTWLDKLNVNNVKTDAGTAYVTERVSATVADGSSFWRHVLSTEDFDLIDKRANGPACTKFVEEHGTPPPGINYSVMRELGVRRA